MGGGLVACVDVLSPAVIDVIGGKGGKAKLTASSTASRIPKASHDGTVWNSGDMKVHGPTRATPQRPQKPIRII